MPNTNEDEVIDLTSLDGYVPCKIPIVICGDVIDLANDSFDGNEDKLNKQASSKARDGIKKNIGKAKEKPVRAGLCSICWDKLGSNPLASTKCGHVFCLVCLERSLKCDRRCPTCRLVLKGVSAYHPLYIALG